MLLSNDGTHGTAGPTRASGALVRGPGRPRWHVRGWGLVALDRPAAFGGAI